ncbi:secretion/DNA translocation related TadE-like protein [Kribbella sp. VKM Ac-2527]|uniref:Secretion/DNA translocation related TadE-like protein n=1 Tax=Kribbella caucasensis TaxID=2512215 RepID=A0A4R6KII3_9ACTN|nr:Rv3654c family TadE-like protein [Kribbella sp. VKM Ac-2527]TDO50844.1 secretion/DNA translocation related TadE-like protein [Kribbella sp. VKM Ac-2527]
MTHYLRQRHRHRVRNERGAGTLLMLWVALAFLGAGLLAVPWIVVSLGSHRANTAADLAALSAAQAIQSGDPDACKTAREIATVHHAEVTQCAVNGEVVSLTVAVHLRLGALGTPTIHTNSRAGPVTEIAADPGGADWADDG